MKKVVIIAISLLVVLGATGFGVYVFLENGRVSIHEKTNTTVNDDGKEMHNKVIEIEDNKFTLGKEFPDGMSEHEVQDAIHGMSHQKVKAEDKWGFIPLTQERVNRLLQVVKMNKEEYQHTDVYLGILKRWKNNDFTSVDKDHNAIWSLQHGNIGKATGILSLEEEKAYIQKQYKIKE